MPLARQFVGSQYLVMFLGQMITRIAFIAIILFCSTFCSTECLASTIPFSMETKKQNNLIKIHKLSMERKWNDAAHFAIRSEDRDIMLFTKALKEVTISPGVYDEEVMRKFLELDVATAYKNVGNPEAPMMPLNYHVNKIIYDYNHISPNRKDKAIQKIRSTWRNKNFSKADEDLFYGRFRSMMTVEDNNTRMDNLLWSNNIDAARRMLPRIGGSQKTILQARFNIKTSKDFAELKRIMGKLSADHAKNGAIMYEKVLWMHNSQQDYKDVVELLVRSAAPEDHKYNWWLIARYYIRDFLSQESTAKMHKIAYILAVKYKPTAGPDAADAEWTAGWIALRFLKVPHLAYRHFVGLYDSSSMVNTLSRASYWAGMASNEMRQKQNAQKWFNISSGYPTTFYGQLSMTMLSKNPQLNLLAPNISRKAIASIQQKKIAKFLYYACVVHDAKLAEVLMRIGINNIQDPAELEVFALIPSHFMMSNVSIYGAQFASMQKKVTLISSSYPIHYVGETAIDKPLCLSIIRKESLFNRMAKSSSGARGLMQVRPETGQYIASKLKIDYSHDKLFDPQFNITVGSNQMKDMLRSTGNLVMSLVAYNAGYGNLKKIMAIYGDPRQIGNIQEIIDWIELMPYPETREYVHRVLESVQVYRALLSGGNHPIKLGIVNDLQGKYIS